MHVGEQEKASDKVDQRRYATSTTAAGSYLLEHSVCAATCVLSMRSLQESHDIEYDRCEYDD
jgi:hypothetical protein